MPGVRLWNRLDLMADVEVHVGLRRATADAGSGLSGPGLVVHLQVAERVLAQGLIDLKLIEGPLDAALESGSYKRFYMHRAGHWLGMDVHDAGLYRVQGASQRLVPGMALTVEPGIYLPGWGGIRLENMVVVREEGCENLNADTTWLDL